jgi:hypothetical protein
MHALACGLKFCMKILLLSIHADKDCTWFCISLTAFCSAFIVEQKFLEGSVMFHIYRKKIDIDV